MKVLPNPMDIKEMFDVKSWLEKHLTTPKKHSRPLHYRFIRSADGEIEIQYKGLHNQQWKVLRNKFFKAYENEKPYLPYGTPKLLKPVYDKDSLDRFSKQVNTIRHLFSKEEHFEWWNSFIREINRNRRLSTQPEWILKTLPRQTDRPIPDEENDDIPAELDRLLQMETEETEVIDNYIV